MTSTYCTVYGFSLTNELYFLIFTHRIGSRWTSIHCYILWLFCALFYLFSLVSKLLTARCIPLMCLFSLHWLWLHKLQVTWELREVTETESHAWDQVVGNSKFVYMSYLFFIITVINWCTIFIILNHFVYAVCERSCVTKVLNVWKTI